MSYYALPGILGTLMSQTVTLCPRLVFVSIVTLVFGNNECSPRYASHANCFQSIQQQMWMCNVCKCWRSVSYKHLGLVLLASEDGQEQDR